LAPQLDLQDVGVARDPDGEKLLQVRQEVALALKQLEQKTGVAGLEPKVAVAVTLGATVSGSISQAMLLMSSLSGREGPGRHRRTELVFDPPCSGSVYRLLEAPNFFHRREKKT
jgi:hypothetical protein